MNILKIIINLIIIAFIWMFFNTANAAINMTISPIKYELNSHTWAVITKQAKITNHTNETIHIITWKSDFVSNWEDWMPRFIRKSEEVFAQELSDWITIDIPSFDIAPNETKTINFTINIPDNATPGGHYWAVFFKNNNSENSSWTNVWINVDYGVLILLNIDWKIKSEINIWTPIIINWNSWQVIHMDVCNETGWDKSWDYYDWKCLADNNSINDWWNPDEWNTNQQENTNTGQNNNQEWNQNNTNTEQNSNINNTENNLSKNLDESIKKDDCVIDFTNSNFDWKCIDNVDKIVSQITWNIENVDINTQKNNENKEYNNNQTENNNENINKNDNNNFEIKIGIPINNIWNTHVKPSWKIVLTDENWKEIKGVWKEVIKNEKWAIVWEKIVNYLPFNDVWGNILPWTKRVYESDWKWFPYKSYDNEWNIVINYWTPTEYYTEQNLNKKTFIMPWERICSKISHKKITASFNINYPDENWDNVEYNSAKEFYVDYKEQYVWINPYFFILLWLLWLILFLIFLIFKKKKVKCINKNCKRKINKDIKICPYCWQDQTKQNKKENTKKDPKIIIAAKKQKLKTKKLELKENIKNILIENKLKYAEDITKLNSWELLKIKWIWIKAIDEIKKALKKEKMKLKK